MLGRGKRADGAVRRRAQQEQLASTDGSGRRVSESAPGRLGQTWSESKPRPLLYSILPRRPRATTSHSA